MSKVLVCGGRDYNNIPYLCGFLDCFHTQTGISLLIEGGAKGTDHLAQSWAKTHNVTFTTYRANWDKHGKSAGPIRNRQMLEEGLPDVVIAFPGGRGTDNMIDQARKKGIPVIMVPR